jgi:hypothetical protein
MRGKLIIIGFLFIILSCSKSADKTPSSISPGTTNPPSSTSKVPAAPSDIILKINSISSVTVSWTDLSTNESGYKVERSINNSVFSEIASLSANSSSYIDSNLNPSTIYTYRVYAFNTSGNSSYSSTVNYTVPAFVVVTANNIEKFTDISLMITGKILNSGNKGLTNSGYPYAKRDFVWNTKPIVVDDNIFVNNKASAELSIPTSIGSIGNNTDSTFGFYIYNLKPSTKYYFRLYYMNGGTNNQLGFSNEIVITTKPAPSVPIGQSYQGGYLAYYLQPSDTLYDQNVPHGIIISPIDQSASIEWLKFGTTFTATSRPMPNTNFSKIGYGRINNSNVMASSQSSAFPAFYLCDTLTLGGYKDWILPSSEELYLSVKSVYSFMNSSISTTNFKGSQYWTSTFGVTSTLSDPLQAKYINFTPIEIKEMRVYDKKYIRAIRYF